MPVVRAEDRVPEEVELGKQISRFDLPLM